MSDLKSSARIGHARHGSGDAIALEPHRRGTSACAESHSWLAHHAKIHSMQTDQILGLLIQERDKLNRAIEALQGPTKRRGRPPKNSLTVSTPAAPEAAPPPKKQRRKFSAAQREAAAERMRQRWAAKKKAQAKPQSKLASKLKKTAKAV